MQFLKSVSQHKTVWLVWLMVMISNLGVEILFSEDHPSVVMLLSKVLIAAGISMWLLFLSLKQQWKGDGLTGLLAFCAVSVPLLAGPLWEWMCGYGHAFELKLLIGFRNLTFVTLVWSATERFEKLSAVLSLFLVLFCIAISQDHSMPVLCVLYMVVAISWLSVSYWASLKTQKVKGQKRVTPWFFIATGACLVIAILVLFVIPESQRVRMAEGFMPSSGGDKTYSPFANSGVGDGENLVAGTTDAMSFAPLDDAPFMESVKPSLYDVVQDVYGESKPPIKQQRAVSIVSEQFKKNHNRMAEAKKSAKEFSLYRKQKKSAHRHLKDTDTTALFHVKGRVPVHLRHTVYDLFDGSQWYPEKLGNNYSKRIDVRQLDNKPWITWDYFKGFGFITGIESHSLQIVNLDTNRIVSPVNTAGVHIDQCDRSDMFCWIQNDILGMDRETVPNLLPIHLQSRLVDESSFQEYPPINSSQINSSQINSSHKINPYSSYPSGDDWEQIRLLAQKWTTDCKTDWERARAICKNLREKYLLAPDTTVPEDRANSVYWFLFEKRKGPDYLFASTAVMMLRSLSIDCRAVSGFYADDKNYDDSTRQTSVYKSNLHWWVEIHLGCGCWQTIEPTPGYSVLQPRLTFLKIVSNTVLLVFQNAVIYWPISLILIIGSVMACFYWRKLLARFLIWQWIIRNYWFGHSRKVREILLETINIWDRRLQLANSSRPSCSSISSHILKSQKCEQQLEASIALQLSCLSDWAIYSASDNPPIPIEQKEIRTLCYQWLTHSASEPTTESSSTTSTQITNKVS